MLCELIVHLRLLTGLDSLLREISDNVARNEIWVLEHINVLSTMYQKTQRSHLSVGKWSAKIVATHLSRFRHFRLP